VVTRTQAGRRGVEPKPNRTGGRDQQAVAVRPFQHDVGNRAERRARPVADHDPDPAAGADAGDRAVEAQPDPVHGRRRTRPSRR
jgi:hypothetical protein